MKAVRRLVLSLGLIALAPAWVTWGQPSVSVLDFASGVRAAGLAGAFVGVADDEQALIYNPAGLALLDGLRAHARLESHLSAATVGSLMGAVPSFGAGLMFYSVGGLVQRDEQDQEGEPFGYGQLALSGAGALRLGSFIGLSSLKTLAVGLRVQVLTVNTLTAGSGLTFTLDPSVLWELGTAQLGPLNLSAIRLGAALDNLGPGLRYGNGHEESLNLGARLGASARWQALLLGVELGTAAGLSVGVEYELSLPNAGQLAVRTGVNTRNGLTFALGLGFRFQERFRVDYAFTSQAQLGGSHQLSVSLEFATGRLF